MRSQKRRTLAFAALLILLFTLASLSYGLLQQPQTIAPPELQPEKPPEILHPTPANIKQKVGILVFLGWLWLSILVLVYFLRLKIQEADRLYQLEFYSQPKD